MSNDKITISVSTRGYESKDDAVTAISGGNSVIPNMEFEEVRLSPADILEHVQAGYTLAHLFRHSAPTFVAHEKTIDGFTGTEFIPLDFDGASQDMMTYISKLETKPTIGYSSFGHGKEGLIKFRLIYCLHDRITSADEYRGRWEGLVRRLLEEAGNTDGLDRCTHGVHQCIFGTCRSDDRQYYVDPINTYHKDSIEWIVSAANDSKDSKKASSRTSIPINITIDRDMVNDFLSMSPGDFVDRYRRLIPRKLYKPTTATLDPFLHAYIIPDDRVWGEVIEAFDFKQNKPMKWKSGRSNKSFLAALNFHSIYGSSLTAEQLLFLMAEYALRNFILSTWEVKGYPSWKHKILKVVCEVISRGLYRILPEHKRKGNNLYFEVDKIWCRENNVNASAYARTVEMKHRMMQVLKYWQFDRTDTWNLANLQKKGIAVTKNMMTRWREHQDVMDEVLGYLRKNGLIEVVEDTDRFSAQVKCELKALTALCSNAVELRKDTEKWLRNSADKAISRLRKYNFSNTVSKHSKGQMYVRDVLMALTIGDKPLRPTEYHYYFTYLMERLHTLPTMKSVCSFVDDVFFPERCHHNEYAIQLKDGWRMYYPVKGNIKAFGEAIIGYFRYSDFKYNLSGEKKDEWSEILIIDTDKQTPEILSFIKEAICYASRYAGISITSQQIMRRS